MKKKISKKLLLLVIPLIFIAVPLFRILLKPAEEEKAETGTPVIVSVPEKGTIRNTLSYPGNLMAETTTTIVPKIAGKVLTIYVEENQIIVKDQILFSLEDDVVRLQMEQAKAAWTAAEAQYSKAQRGVRVEELESVRASVNQAEEALEIAASNLERTEILYNSGTIARAKYEEVLNLYRSADTDVENAKRSLRLMEQGASDEDLAMAQANADAAGKQYELAQLQLDFALVRSPVSGTIAKILVEEGNMVGPGIPLLAVVNYDLIFADVAVPEKHYGNISGKGETIRAEIFPIAYTELPPFPGEITGIAPIIDPQSRTFNVEIAVKNGSSLLRPGMFVNANIILDQIENAMMVPSRAVLFRNGQEVVFLLTEGNSYHASMVPVETGIEEGGFVQILSGLTFEDSVIVKGNAFLEDNQLVEVVVQ